MQQHLFQRFPCGQNLNRLRFDQCHRVLHAQPLNHLPGDKIGPDRHKHLNRSRPIARKAGDQGVEFIS